MELWVLLAAIVAPIGIFAGLRWVDARRPLVLGPRMVVQQLGDRRVWRVRACLGSGRAVSRYEVDARWTDDKRDVAVATEGPVGPRLGAWTITLTPPEGAGSSGRLRVSVRAWGGGRAWEAEGAFVVADAAAGRFSPLATRADAGRVRIATDWDRVEAGPAQIEAERGAEG